ncbi:hypothetical protein [Microbulbifer sp.]|uniref:hypothetical protein n=1 Tax=Microbulbifer sp. TaxID=1908541 RepID=UPI003F36C7BF
MKAKVQRLNSTAKVNRKAKWRVPDDAPRTVDELNFTSRDPEGRIRWWDITRPKTDYWHALEYLGRGYAFELLDLINNPNKKGEVDHVFRCVAQEIVRERSSDDGVASGFFAVFSEYMVTGTASR